MKLKRFILFVGERYYPYGGWYDFHSSYDTKEEMEEAWEKIKPTSHDLWMNFVDTENLEKHTEKNDWA
jgi:hypothetical protein